MTAPTDRQVIDAWRDDLLFRLRRAHLVFELVDVDPDTVRDLELADEVALFRAVSTALQKQGQVE